MNLMFQVLRAMRLGELQSAEQLSKANQVSRADIVQAMQEARDYGVEVRPVRGRGYELTETIDWLDDERIRAAMGPQSARCRLQVVDHIGSTNDAARDDEIGTDGRIPVVTAELQSSGRGRRGRRWNSGIGNAITFSLLFNARNQLALLSASTLVVGVAIVRAVQSLGARGVLLKWPNDLICERGKLGGILVESLPEPRMGTLIVGVGINVDMPEKFKLLIDQPTWDLRSLGVVADRSTILGTCVRHLMEALDEFDSHGFADLRDEWLAHAAFRSQTVDLMLGNGEVERGVLAGIATDGALLFATPHGQKKIYSGEISLRGVAGSQDQK